MIFLVSIFRSSFLSTMESALATHDVAAPHFLGDAIPIDHAGTKILDVNRWQTSRAPSQHEAYIRRHPITDMRNLVGAIPGTNCTGNRIARTPNTDASLIDPNNRWLRNSASSHIPNPDFMNPKNALRLGECLPGTCPARYLCMKYLISSPKFILTLASPPSRPH